MMKKYFNDNGAEITEAEYSAARKKALRAEMDREIAEHQAREATTCSRCKLPKSEHVQVADGEMRLVARLCPTSTFEVEGV